MLYQSPADFSARYAEKHSSARMDESGNNSTLDTVTVVSETADTARVEALWFTYGHEPDAGYFDVFERTAFLLVRQPDGWRLEAEEDLGYE